MATTDETIRDDEIIMKIALTKKTGWRGKKRNK
jgi:hypothetical protein